MRFRIFPKLHPAEPWDRRARLVINNLASGKLNVVGEVTLTANSSTTTLSDPAVASTSVVLLMPMTADAAAAVGETYFNPPSEGEIVINHANNPQVDRQFRYAVIG